MHFITFVKTTGQVIDYRQDSSVPPYWTESSLRSAVSNDRNFAEDDIDTLAFDALPQYEANFKGPLTPNEHAYDAANNILKNNPAYVAPVVERRWNIGDVMSQLSLAEKTKFINNMTPTVVTAKEELKTPRNLVDTTGVLQFLVDSGDISQDSMSKILA